MTENFIVSNAVSDSAYVNIPDTPETHIKYQFNGYQLNKIQLDSTGDSTYVVPVHPYYYNQPEYWAKPYYESRNPVVTKGQASDGFVENVTPNFESIIVEQSLTNPINHNSGQSLTKMIPLE